MRLRLVRTLDFPSRQRKVAQIPLGATKENLVFIGLYLFIVRSPRQRPKALRVGSAEINASLIVLETRAEK